MNCQEFWNQAPEGLGPPGAELAAHLSECPACASGWAAQRNLAAGLRQVAADWNRMEAPARVEARLVSVFREQAGLPAIRQPQAWIAALTWATAAAAVLALAFSLIRVHVPQSATPKPVPANTPIFATVQGVADPATAAEASDPDAGFIPLPNVEQLAPNEPGDVVRVEVPRSAMIAVGFAVSPERAAEPVQAEVVFGPDGVARAVRFLDETF
jgi:hypothetical protein